ncbi:MAG: VOC family protein [Gammaproteobacteria bacterium]
MNLPLRPFHLAFPVDDITEARRFYAEILGCAIGRESKRWIDFDFFGHQITAHLVRADRTTAISNVDGDSVPIGHFGLILAWNDWHSLRDRLTSLDIPFIIGPRIRFQGQAGEQATLFVHDPSGNALEFKSFRNDEQIFAHDP